MNSEPPISRADLEALRAELAMQAEQIAELQLSRWQRAKRSLRRNKRIVLVLSLASALIPLSLYALSITKSFNFTAGNAIVASEVNANFDQLFTKVNELAAYHPPIGTILAWHKSLAGTPSLPASGEWVECNGQILADAASPYNGQTVPNLNGDAAGANSPGQSAKVQMFLRGGLTSGVGQQDAFQGHRHAPLNPSNFMGRDGVSNFAAGVSPMADNISTGDPITDGTNGTPRTASETRPVNMSVVWIMKGPTPACGHAPPGRQPSGSPPIGRGPLGQRLTWRGAENAFPLSMLMGRGLGGGVTKNLDAM